MEEEYFFYYLTHGSETYAKKWDSNNNDSDDIKEQVSPNDIGTSSMTPPSQHQQQQISQPQTVVKNNNNSYSHTAEVSRGLQGFDSQMGVSNQQHHQQQNRLDLNSIHSEPTSVGASSVKSEGLSEGLSLETNERIFLLPPMNGTVDYSNLKRDHNHKLQTSMHSVSKHGFTGMIPDNGSLYSLDGSSYHGSINGSRHGGPMLERGDSFFKPLSRRNSSFFEPLSRRASSFVEPFNDHRGKPKSVVAGLFNLTVVGTILGLIMPQNGRLPTPWYRMFSSIIGYSYFIFWCASFYPQVVMNFQRKSTDGLSIDYSVVNLFGYICYTTYTCMFYWNKTVRTMYFERHAHDNADGTPPEITVESNDVAFAIHALVMSIIWLIQLEIYGGFEKCRKLGKRIVSKPMTTLIFFIVGSCSAYAGLITYSNSRFSIFSEFHLDNLTSWLNWLDYLYYVAYMKVVITTAKYIPQVKLNMKRKSCVGWNIWNILLDISGGIFSLAQLVGDAIDLNDLSSIKGNSAKLGLSAVSIFFDVSTSQNSSTKSTLQYLITKV